jgi:hypothetical protein
MIQDSTPAGTGIIKREWLRAHDEVKEQLRLL